MKIILLGKDGQVGRELQRSLSVVGEVLAFGRTEADFENPEALSVLIARHAPDVIVNAAAYTAVDKAKDEPEKARLVNADSVRAIAAAAARCGAWLVHYSTDYVFDGTKQTHYVEDDVTAPLNVYGLTKRDGEEAIIHSGVKYVILRTSWVYAAHGKNFAKTILRLAAEREELKIVADQIGTPTSAEMIADVTALIVQQLKQDDVSVTGIYHLTASGYTSWHGYARFLVKTARARGMALKATEDTVLPVPSSEYPTPEPRPARSCLNTEKLKETFGIHLPEWQYHVTKLIESLVI